MFEMPAPFEVQAKRNIGKKAKKNEISPKFPLLV
jgi:hypothetical protein